MKALTATEQKIYDALSPGHPVPLDDLVAAVGDGFTERVTVQVHISNLRDKIASNGLNVMAQGGKYFLVRMLNRNHE